jgi:TfoX/Sxy family transcriptional regulator of competence genes
VKRHKTSTGGPKPAAARRPPPVHKLTLDESITRLALRGVTSKRMFGGLCYYVDNKPFCFLLADDLALKLPATQLRAGSDQRTGRRFNPGGGVFIMREYLALSEQTMADEDLLDGYVSASYRFVLGQDAVEDELEWNDLLHGRAGLYKK